MDAPERPHASATGQAATGFTATRAGTMTERVSMAESRGFEPLTLTGSALSGRLPRPSGRSPLIGGSLGQRIDHRLDKGGGIATATPYATRRVVLPSHATVVAMPPIEEPRVAT